MKVDNPSARSATKPIMLCTMRLTLKNQLRHYLGQRDMTASQLARMAKVPKQSLSGWLAGSKPRDIEQVKRVADALAVSLDNLMFGSGTDPSAERATELEALLGDGWVTGLFEVKFRRVKK